MCTKRILLAYLVLWGSLFVFQIPAPAIGSAQSSQEKTSHVDNRLALNNEQAKKLMKLDKQIKSYEQQLKKLDDKIAKQRKSK